MCPSMEEHTGLPTVARSRRRGPSPFTAVSITSLFAGRLTPGSCVEPASYASHHQIWLPAGSSLGASRATVSTLLRIPMQRHEPPNIAALACRLHPPVAWQPARWRRIEELTSRRLLSGSMSWDRYRALSRRLRTPTVKPGVVPPRGLSSPCSCACRSGLVST